MSVDPKRILDDANAKTTLATLLRNAENDTLEADAIERVRLGVLTGIGGGIATSGRASGHAGKAASHIVGKILGSWAAKAGISVIVLTTAGAGGLLATRDRTSPPKPASLASTSLADEAPPTATSAFLQPPTDTNGASTAPAVSASTAPSAKYVPAVTTASTATTQPPTSAATLQEGLAQSPLALTPPSTTKTTEPANSPGSQSNSIPQPQAALTTSRSGLSHEGTLLVEARHILPTDPARALELVREHAREFPMSELAPERTRIEREAIRRLATSPSH